MSHLNIRSLFQNTTDEEFKKLFNDNHYKDIDVIYKGKGYTHEDFEKEFGKNKNLKK